MRRLPGLAPLVGLLASGGPALAQQVELHGYAKALGEVGLSDGAISATARLQQDLSAESGPASLRAAFDLDVTVPGPDQMAERGAEVSLLPVECRVDIAHDWFDLSLGKQFVFWGQTDWVNPTDLFTPWDYAHMSNEIEDYRLAPWAARWTAWVRSTSFDLVWVPLPIPNLIDFSSMESETLGVSTPQMPERTIANGELGLRISTNVWGVDLSAMAFHGLDKRPGMTMAFDPTASPQLTLIPTYGKLDAVGADVARGVGSFLIKAEAAYYWTEDRAGDDPAVRNPELYAVAGLTYVPNSNLNFSVQGTMNALSRYDPDAELARLQAMGQADPDVDPEVAWGLVERVAYTWRDLVSLSVVGVQGIPEGDHFEMVFVSWRAADALTVLGGAVLFGGPVGSRFGELEDSSRAFAEVKLAY